MNKMLLPGVNVWPALTFDATVKIRYNHAGTAATVMLLENNRARIRLHEPQRAVTPGQAAVIYAGDIVIGGGWICRNTAVNRSSEAVLA